MKTETKIKQVLDSLATQAESCVERLSFSAKRHTKYMRTPNIGKDNIAGTNIKAISMMAPSSHLRSWVDINSNPAAHKITGALNLLQFREYGLICT
jgi:hypothetical protein